MSLTKLKIKALGLRYFIPVLSDWLISKLAAMQSKTYKANSYIVETFYKGGVSSLKLDKDNTWKVGLSVSGKDVNLTLRNDDSDVLVFSQVFFKKEYKRLAEIVKPRQDKPVLVFDLGANVGLTSVYLSALLKEIEVLAVEPDEANYSTLVTNLKQNSIKFTALQKGVWVNKVRLSVDHSFRDGKSWSLTVQEDPEGSIEGIDLNDLIGDQVLDILKIDIEGTEFKLFENSEYASGFLSKTRYIAIEIHDEIGERAVIEDCLIKNGFEIFYDGELTIGTNKSISL